MRLSIKFYIFIPKRGTNDAMHAVMYLQLYDDDVYIADVRSTQSELIPFLYIYVYNHVSVTI